jgi:glyoxylase I family protein
MSVQNVAHFGICVRDPERSMRFYCDLLGFEPTSKLIVSDSNSSTLLGLEPLDLHSYFIERDRVRIELLHYRRPGCVGEATPRPMNQLGLTHIALRVERLVELLERLAAGGFEVIESSRVENAELAASVVFAVDPDGVRIELIEMPGDPQKPLGEPLRRK